MEGHGAGREAEERYRRREREQDLTCPISNATSTLNLTDFLTTHSGWLTTTNEACVRCCSALTSCSTATHHRHKRGVCEVLQRAHQLLNRHTPQTHPPTTINRAQYEGACDGQTSM